MTGFDFESIFEENDGPTVLITAEVSQRAAEYRAAEADIRLTSEDAIVDRALQTDEQLRMILRQGGRILVVYQKDGGIELKEPVLQELKFPDDPSYSRD